LVFKEETKDKMKMYQMPQLVDDICNKLISLFIDEHIIFFLDEIACFGNPQGLDWSDFRTGPSINVLLAISPVSLGSKKNPSIWEGRAFSKQRENEFLKIPSQDSFFIQKLSHRYRNSRSIQELTLFIGKQMKKYLVLDEEPETNVVGEKPTWCDIADKKEKLRPALEDMKKSVENDKKNQIVLLYDKKLPTEIKSILRELEEPRKSGGFGWTVMEEQLFHGMERDTVFYVGTGHLEAFTRARLKLFIITYAADVKTKDSWYLQYKDALTQAAKDGLLHNVNLPTLAPLNNDVTVRGWHWQRFSCVLGSVCLVVLAMGITWIKKL